VALVGESSGGVLALFHAELWWMGGVKNGGGKSEQVKHCMDLEHCAHYCLNLEPTHRVTIVIFVYDASAVGAASVDLRPGAAASVEVSADSFVVGNTILGVVGGVREMPGGERLNESDRTQLLYESGAIIVIV
jgi:hypothetical protein